MELDAVRAPLTVENVLRYVRDGFYDGLVIHRVAANFVVQGGGYDTAYLERPTHGPVPNESGNGLSNTRGTVGLARTESPHSGTSQFYINLVDNLGLDPLPSRWGYAVFGRVVEGMDVIDRIGHVATGARGRFPAEVPLEQIVIERAYVLGEGEQVPTAPVDAPADASARAGEAVGAAPGAPDTPETPGEPEPAPESEAGAADEAATPARDPAGDSLQ